MKLTQIAFAFFTGVALAAATLGASPAKADDQFVPKMGRNCPNATRDAYDGTCRLNTSVDVYWVNPNNWSGGTSCRGSYFFSEGYCVRTR